MSNTRRTIANSEECYYEWYLVHQLMMTRSNISSAVSRRHRHFVPEEDSSSLCQSEPPWRSDWSRQRPYSVHSLTRKETRDQSNVENSISGLSLEEILPFRWHHFDFDRLHASRFSVPPRRYHYRRPRKEAMQPLTRDKVRKQGLVSPDTMRKWDVSVRVNTTLTKPERLKCWKEIRVQVGCSIDCRQSALVVRLSKHDKLANNHRHSLVNVVLNRSASESLCFRHRCVGNVSCSSSFLLG